MNVQLSEPLRWSLQTACPGLEVELSSVNTSVNKRQWLITVSRAGFQSSIL